MAVDTHAPPAPLTLPPPPARALYTGVTYLVHRPASLPRPATVLNIRRARLGGQEAYISFVGQDKRLDTWVPEAEVGERVVEESVAGPSSAALPLKSPSGGSKRRKLAKPLSTLVASARQPASADGEKNGADSLPLPSTPDREHAALTRVRNFEDVRFGEYCIGTWYYSPYPLPPEDPSPANSQMPKAANGTFLKKGKAPMGRTDSPAPMSAQEGKSRALAASRSIGDLLHGSVGKAGEGSRGRLWACDLCFNYMRTRSAWERHSSACQQFLPPGRRVYQRGSYSIWEVDGAAATLYCQNLSLFGKLFIDHKSVFFHVENFLFYIMCDASTSYRDQPMAFFSKEKISFDDYNLACIVTFPPFQGNGLGKLLIEFSYYLTKHPATRPKSLSPGTPERPLSDLGLKGYMAYWASTILRYLRTLLADAPSLASSEPSRSTNGAQAPKAEGDGARKLRGRASVPGVSEGKMVDMDGICMIKQDLTRHKGQYNLILTLSTLASACHLRIDDTASTLAELGLLVHKRPITTPAPPSRKRRVLADGEDSQDDAEEVTNGGQVMNHNGDVGDGETGLKGAWEDMEVVVSREEVERLCKAWMVRERPMLDTEFVLL